MRIRELRKAQQLTQQEVADSLNIERTSYARYESGSREPDLATLIALADLFQVSLDYLCGRTETPGPRAGNDAALPQPKEAEQGREQETARNDLPKDRRELEDFIKETLNKMK